MCAKYYIKKALIINLKRFNGSARSFKHVRLDAGTSEEIKRKHTNYIVQQIREQYYTPQPDFARHTNATVLYDLKKI